MIKKSISSDLGETQKCTSTPYSLEGDDFFLFSKLKIHFRVRFKDVEDIYGNMMTQLQIILKRTFRGTLSKDKLTGISVLNAKETILKKINISSMVNFYFGKYIFMIF